MKFDLVSDLHVDTHYTLPNLNPKSDILVIAGDTSNSIGMTRLYLHKIAPLYKKIIFILGNHEHYDSKGRPVDITEYLMSDDLPDNVFFLSYKSPFHIHDEKYMFIGLTGWYDFNYPGKHPRYQKKAWESEINDSRLINFSQDKENWQEGIDDNEPEEHAKRHAKMLEALVRSTNTTPTVQRQIQEIIVVTHTIPIVSGCVSPDHPWAYLNGSFYNSFMFNVWNADKNNLIKAWCFGHTHFPCYRYENGIHFYCNPRGYYHEQNDKEYHVIQIDTEAGSEYK